MGRQVEHLAARFDPADSHRPTVFLVGAIDVRRHHIGGVHPGVFLAPVAVGVLLEGELLDRLGLRAVGQAGQHARHAQRDVAAVDLVAQPLPRRGSTNSSAGRPASFARFAVTHGGDRLLVPVHHRLRLVAFAVRTAELTRGQGRGLPVSVRGAYAHARVFDHAEPRVSGDTCFNTQLLGLRRRVSACVPACRSADYGRRARPPAQGRPPSREVARRLRPPDPRIKSGGRLSGRADAIRTYVNVILAPCERTSSGQWSRLRPFRRQPKSDT